MLYRAPNRTSSLIYLFCFSSPFHSISLFKGPKANAWVLLFFFFFVLKLYLILALQVIRRLFSRFDPLSSFRLSWSVFLVALVIAPSMSLGPSLLKTVPDLASKGLSDQLGLALLANQPIVAWLSRRLVCLALINLIGLMPYAFTIRAQMCFSLSVALLLWASPLIFKSVVHPKHLISHLVPLGSPILLSPFIVLVERVRLLIRPITLSVRLAANIVAGHLLLTLSGGLCAFSFKGTLGLVPQLILGGLELAVAGVQAYVLFILVRLYIREYRGC